MSSGNIVKLDIGGTVFKTTKSTLTKYDGLLKTKLKKEVVPVDENFNACIFIDRSAKHFDDILNYLRDEHVELPESKKELKEIQNEAQFYQLEGLVKKCMDEIGKRAPKSNAPEVASNESVVKLNIGGTVFQTTKSTLTKFDGLFKIMLEYDAPLKKDESGCIFIDRSGKHFDKILNYLRDGNVALSGSVEDLEEIQKEAQYYLLDNLIKLCKDEVEKRAPKSNAPEIASSDSFVKLNIGGTVFQTTKSTLTKSEGLFKTMLESKAPITKDNSGCIFIDRNARHFNIILDYLRDGHVELPESEEKLKEIQKEAQFYLLNGLVYLCKIEIIKIDNGWFGKNIQTIDKHGEMLRVMERSFNKPALIIYYHVSQFGKTRCPIGFYIQSFLKKYKNKIDVFFKSYHNNASASSKVTAANCWHWSLHYNGAHLPGAPKYDDTTYAYDLVDEPFLEQLENSIQDFFTNYVHSINKFFTSNNIDCYVL